MSTSCVKWLCKCYIIKGRQLRSENPVIKTKERVSLLKISVHANLDQLSQLGKLHYNVLSTFYLR